jgi:hypothetical protein
MLKNSITIGLIFAVFLSTSCNRATSKAVESQITVEVAKPLEPMQEKVILKQSGGKVEFKGVSFSCNPQIFGEVEAEEVAEHPLSSEDDKPDENFPNHIEFYLGKTQYSESKGRIAVMPINDYRRMFSVSNKMVKSFDENLSNLQQMLRDIKFSENGKIPFMPFYDATQVFNAKIKHVSFKNGKGFCFLTQFDQDINLINNDGITYYCQGITSDEGNYIFAVFPVEVSFLPKSYYTNEFEGYKTPTKGFIETDKELKQYENYVAKTTKRLENLPDDKYEPNLKYYEEIISSLKIEK